MTVNLRAVHDVMLRRCLAVCEMHPEEGGETSTNHLAWLCRTGLQHLNDWPVDKLSRWLGYVQGCLACKKLQSVKEERDFSRPLFHAAYAGVETIPETLERTTGGEVTL